MSCSIHSITSSPLFRHDLTSNYVSVDARRPFLFKRTTNGRNTKVPIVLPKNISPVVHQILTFEFENRNEEEETSIDHEPENWDTFDPDYCTDDELLDLVCSTDSIGNTFLNYISQKIYSEQDEDGATYLKMAEKLIEFISTKKRSCNLKGSGGKTKQNSIEGDFQTVQLQLNEYTSRPNKYGETPLFYAIFLFKETLALKLINSEASVIHPTSMNNHRYLNQLNILERAFSIHGTTKEVIGGSGIDSVLDAKISSKPGSLLLLAVYHTMVKTVIALKTRSACFTVTEEQFFKSLSSDFDSLKQLENILCLNSYSHFGLYIEDNLEKKPDGMFSAIL